MSTDCTLFVERRERDGSWSMVDRWRHLVARRARKLFPAGPLRPEHLIEAEGVLLLEARGREGPRRAWEVGQNYALFYMLAGVRARGLPSDKILALPRGFPPDLSPGVLRLAGPPSGYGHESSGGHHTPSWLTMTELSPIMSSGQVFADFVESVLRPMASVHPDRDRVRAVFWFES